MRKVFVLAAVLLVSCNGSPTDPDGSPRDLPLGRYSNDTSCVSIAQSECDLVAGCWHGRFTRPTIASGRFSVSGTYRLEAGPVSTDPPPPATFSGTIAGTTLTITVERTDKSIPPATYVVTLAGAGNCPQLCL